MKKTPIELVLIKATHTLVWFIMVTAIFYVLYAAIIDDLGLYTWIATGLIAAEITALATNNWICPLTDMAKKYLDHWEMGDDIYLPRWIATHNREIFSPPLVLEIILLFVRLIMRLYGG